jgi:hypothetical protein
MAVSLFIPHAQPLSGHADPPLPAAGREQAAAPGRWLTGEEVDVVVAGLMARAPCRSKPVDKSESDWLGNFLPDIAEASPQAYGSRTGDGDPAR